MATAKQRQAARKNIKKAQAAWQGMSSREGARAQPEPRIEEILQLNSLRFAISDRRLRFKNPHSAFRMFSSQGSDYEIIRE